MRKALPLLCVLLLPGCSSTLAPVNQPPEADIVSISPVVLAQGEMVTLVGTGIDTDGEVVGYRWRSSRDGDFGRLAIVKTNALSVGEHTIYFTVQDNNDAWSDEVQGSVQVVAAARINSFTSSASSIESGGAVTLSWNVSDAGSISIDQGVGVVPATGTTSVKPTTTTTYTLTATGGGMSATASVTVTVKESARRITLTADRDFSGYVRWSGIYRYVGLYAGDDNSNRGFQAFLTYNISRIPDDATIQRVIVDMTGYDLPYESPFPELGCLGAYTQEYTTLYGAYWMDEDVPSPVGQWCGLEELGTPSEQSGFRRALQRKVGENTFQFRLQFADRESDYDDVRDLVHWSRDALPVLIVEYTVD